MNGCIEQVRKPRLREVSDLVQQRGVQMLSHSRARWSIS